MVKDYNCNINYHSDKANELDDALSHKYAGYNAILLTSQVKILVNIRGLDIEILVHHQFQNLASLRFRTQS